METLLSGTKLTEELEFFKRQIDIIATQKVKYPANYVPILAHRPRKATLANVSLPPSAVTYASTDDIIIFSTRFQFVSLQLVEKKTTSLRESVSLKITLAQAR